MTRRTIANAELTALYTAHALAMWAGFDKNERAAVRFGMLPAVKMREAEAAGFTDRRLLAVALMDCAAADGGMRA